MSSDALSGSGDDRSVVESRWKRRPDVKTSVSASSGGGHPNADQLLAESSEDDQSVEPNLQPDSSDQAYSPFSYHKKVRFVCPL